MEHSAVLDLGVSQLPSGVFMLVHFTAFVIALFLVRRAVVAGVPSLAWAFAAFALAEVLYFGYHVGVTTFLLSHTLAEVLDLVAFIVAGTVLARHGVERLVRAAPA